MPDGPEDVLGLVRRTPLSFLGTVTRVGDTRLAEVPAGERMAVVKVDTVLHAPDAFTRLGGGEVTIQLSDDLDLPAVGDAAAFFTDGLAYGEGLAVREVGRLPADAVAPNVSRVARPPMRCRSPRSSATSRTRAWSRTPTRRTRS